jgi:hypothetical protein
MTPVVTNDVGFNAGVLVPFLDESTGVLFTFTSGDTISKYFEFLIDNKLLFEPSNCSSFGSFRAFALDPKYVVDAIAHEIAKFYIVTQSKVFRDLNILFLKRYKSYKKIYIFQQLPLNQPFPSMNEKLVGMRPQRKSVLKTDTDLKILLAHLLLTNQKIMILLFRGIK